MPHGCLSQSKAHLYAIVATPWSSVPCPTCSPFTLLTLVTPSQVVLATKCGYNKPGTPILVPRALSVPNRVLALNHLTVTLFQKKDTAMPYMGQTLHLLNNQVLAIF